MAKNSCTPQFWWHNNVIAYVQLEFSISLSQYQLRQTDGDTHKDMIAMWIYLCEHSVIAPYILRVCLKMKTIGVNILSTKYKKACKDSQYYSKSATKNLIMCHMNGPV